MGFAGQLRGIRHHQCRITKQRVGLQWVPVGIPALIIERYPGLMDRCSQRNAALPKHLRHLLFLLLLFPLRHQLQCRISK